MDTKTQSLCPVCLKKIDAEIVFFKGSYYMEKTCPEHGFFRTVVWRGSTPRSKWIIEKERAQIKKPLTEIARGCPFDCGLCADHRQTTCTALIELTSRCNLHCSFCFADSENGESDPTLAEVDDMYKAVMKASGACNIQLSGGEPTVRDDLAQIIKNGKNAGFRFIQLNTNGIRLAQDENFVRELKEAGLDSVFLQFDGTDDGIYKKLRGRALFDIKKKAIENCGKYNIGVVLVPTIVPGINSDNIGEIIDFALGHIDAVRGVHFQPVSYFGRIPKQPQDSDRITLAELMDEIERKTGGKILAKNLKPPQCENSLCSFHGNFLLRPNGKLVAISANSGCCGKKAEESALKAKVYVSKNWAGRNKKNNLQKKSDWDEILDSINSRSFSVSGMAFQDVFNVDLKRVRDCCIHVVTRKGKLIPFCAYNITDTEGKALYRNRS